MQRSSVALTWLWDPAASSDEDFEGLDCGDGETGTDRTGLPDEAVIWHLVEERPRGGVLALASAWAAVRCT